ncbi:MAG: RNA polymerase sigma factor (sigma-70 family) [Mariniblastus sp.]|jgi:RNA polymerase sigma factor (sigma-70 family)
MSEQPKTRLSLILRLRHTDDATAWQEFVEIYQPLIFRLARAKGLQEADALDTTQEVMTRVAKAINGFDPSPERGSFRGWISRITRNLVIELLRSRKRRPLTSDDSSIAQMINATPESSAETELFDLEHERQVFAWAAEKVRHSFKPKSWQAFWMTAVANRSIDDVAAELEISKGAIYIARSRVMAKLKQKVLHQSQYLSTQQLASELDRSDATDSPSRAATPASLSSEERNSS